MAGHGPQTLAIDIGGTGLKASVLDDSGKMVEQHVRVPTPYPLTPDILVETLAKLTAPLSAYDRISIGFPGVVRDGRIITAPHFKGKAWSDYPLADALARRFGKPARLLNDAEVQGLAIVKKQGLEVVLTLGTGVGTAIFSNGALTPTIHHVTDRRVERRATLPPLKGSRIRRAITHAAMAGPKAVK